MEVNTKYKFDDNLLKDSAYSIKEFIMKLILKIILSLFLVTLMHCGYLFAYQVKVTKLSDKHFDPLPDNIYIWSDEGTIEDYIASDDQYGEQVATITLVFETAEIGQDYGAVGELAKKEARKLGADFIYAVSVTVYKETQEIASMTYRCVRSAIAASFNEDLAKELESSTLFYKKYQEFLEEVGILSHKGDKYLGVKHERIKKMAKLFVLFLT